MAVAQREVGGNARREIAFVSGAGVFPVAAGVQGHKGDWRVFQVTEVAGLIAVATAVEVGFRAIGVFAEASARNKLQVVAEQQGVLKLKFQAGVFGVGVYRSKGHLAAAAGKAQSFTVITIIKIGIFVKRSSVAQALGRIVREGNGVGLPAIKVLDSGLDVEKMPV